jgi:hypothetical protein
MFNDKKDFYMKQPTQYDKRLSEKNSRLDTGVTNREIIYLVSFSIWQIQKKKLKQSFVAEKCAAPGGQTIIFTTRGQQSITECTVQRSCVIKTTTSSSNRRVILCS